MAPEARLDQLQRAVGECLASAKDERRMLLQVLGYCGVLQNPEHPGFLEGFRKISQDEHRQRSDEVQKATDQHIKTIDEALAQKEKEIMHV